MPAILTQSSTPPSPQDLSRESGIRLGIIAVAILLSIAIFSSLGTPAGISPATPLTTIILNGWGSFLLSILFIAGCIGLAIPLRRFWSTSSESAAITAAVGLSLGLTLNHIIGQCGMFRIGTLPIGAMLIPAIGAATLIWGSASLVQRARAGLIPRPSYQYLFWAPAIGILITAASSPPGWLWDTEFGGFDALSYHLQLPQEWFVANRIEPVRHNVYSYLPSYMEAVFTSFAHFGRLPPSDATDFGNGLGLLTPDSSGQNAWPVLACQYVHALITVLGAWIIAALARTMGASRPTSLVIAACALATPWLVVIGSLAYNEGAVIALFAGAMLVAAQRDLSPIIRGVLCAVIIGVACGCKPTAILFCAPPVAILLLGTTPVRTWPTLAAAGIAVGIISLSPWLLRNYMNCGNPVFPYLHTLFGDAHWTSEQFSRYSGAHHANEPLLDRLKLLIFADTTNPGSPQGQGQHRGIIHPQFGWLSLILVGSSAFVLFASHTRRLGMLLVLGLLSQIAAWVFFTHIQSRFLLPLVVPVAALFALALSPRPRDITASATLESADRSARISFWIAALMTTLQIITLGNVFGSQRRSDPNGLLLLGPGMLSGELARAEWNLLNPTEKAQLESNLSAAAWMNLKSIGGSSLLLIGDSTPFYFGGRAGPAGTEIGDGLPHYNVTWDRSIITAAIAGSGQDPAAQDAAISQAIKDAGITHILLNSAELSRLARSGWLDPLLTPTTLQRWLSANATPLREWRGEGRVLYQVKK